MPKMIQLRDVPDSLYQTLKASAASEGMSLSDYIKRELEHSVARPAVREWLRMAERLRPIRFERTPAEIIRELRDSR